MDRRRKGLIKRKVQKEEEELLKNQLIMCFTCAFLFKKPKVVRREEQERIDE